MNELIKVTEHNGVQTVNARELHTALEVGRDFSNWIKDRIEKYGFVEGKDYSPNLANRSDGLPGKPRQDYLLSLGVAKEIAMIENNEHGRRIRQYLIKVEEAWNEPTMIMARALQFADRQIRSKDARIAELEPKAEFFDQVADSKDAIPMREVAAVLNIPGIGRNNLFSILRREKILDGNNIPYREYQDRGYFRVVESRWADKEGDTHINFKTLVYQRGIDFIRRMIKEEAV